MKMAYSRYENYKDSGVSWLRMVPAEWTVIALKRYLLIPVTDGPHETPEFIDEGVPFISAEAIKNAKINFNKKRGFISKEADAIYSRKYKPKRGDIFIVKSGATTGNVAMVEVDDHFNIWSPLAVVRPNPKYIHGRYLFHFLCSENFKISIELGWSFGTQQNIGMNVIENIQVVLPPISEQKTIAEFLDTKTAEVDTLIAKKQALLKLLAEKRIALITQAVTKGLNPNITMKDSRINWLGAVPGNWSVGKISYYYEVQLGKMLQPEPRNTTDILKAYLRAANLAWSGVDLSDIKEMWFNQREMTKYRLRQDDVLVSEGGDVGRTSFWDKDEEIYIQNAINRVRCWNSKKNHSRFIYYWFYYLKIRGLINVICNTSTISHYTAEKVKATPFIIPPMSEQKAIATFLDTKTAEIDAICTKIAEAVDRLKEYRAALITHVVLGEMDVRASHMESIFQLESEKEKVL